MNIAHTHTHTHTEAITYQHKECKTPLSYNTVDSVTKSVRNAFRLYHKTLYMYNVHVYTYPAKCSLFDGTFLTEDCSTGLHPVDTNMDIRQLQT